MIKRNGLRVNDIEKKISDLLDNLEIIKDNLPNDVNGFLGLGLVKDGLYKKAEFAIELVLDICNIINSDLRLGVPENEDDLLDNLESKRIFSKAIVDLIREMKKFRNVLVHKYGNIDDAKAYRDIYDGLEDFEKIIPEIEKFLEKHKKEAVKNGKIKSKNF